MNQRHLKTWAVLISMGFAHLAHAATHSQAALTLLEPGGARAASLGESFSAVSDDVTAVKYNPASVATLKQGQASIMYERGLADDNFGQFALGLPMEKRGALGFTFGYYNGGSIKVFDGVDSRTVQAQQDFNGGVTYAEKIGRYSVGTTGRYFKSTLAEQQSAHSWSADLGGAVGLYRGLRLGIAVQNLGTALHYGPGSYALPTVARTGLAYSFGSGAFHSLGLIDFPYSFDDHVVHTSVGYELQAKTMAFRAGYRSDRDQGNFTVGAGLDLGGWLLDYAFGFVNQLNSTHRLSISVPFGNFYRHSPNVGQLSTQPVPTAPSNNILRVPVTPEPQQIPIHDDSQTAPRRYLIQQGDSWKSLARRFYGREELWPMILNANRAILIDPNDLHVGQAIIIPRRPQ